MKKQYAVLGLGKFGSSVAVTLEKLGCEVIAADMSEEKVQEIADKVSYAMKADLRDIEFLRSLGLGNMDGVVVAISDNMEAAIMSIIVSKEAGVPYVLARAQSEFHASILRKLGRTPSSFRRMRWADGWRKALCRRISPTG